MQEPIEKQQHRVSEARAAMENERREEERRKCKCQGYAYIEMVGWMDRRERVRRDDNGSAFECI